MSDIEQKKQNLSRQIINKILNDAAFREQLSTNPKEALQSGGFLTEYAELYQDSEVSGYSADFSDYCCITGIY